MNLTVLDAKTLGEDISLEKFNDFGKCTVYNETSINDIPERIKDSEVVILNKLKLNESNLKEAKNLKLICVTATGYDNIDVDYCRSRDIAVCNVVGYSSHSVAQTTVAMVLSLATNIRPFNDFVKRGEYTKSGVANKLTPVYYELFGKTWGIVGYGNIGKEVGEIAKALGCNVIYTKRNADDNKSCVDVLTLCKESDIISLHTPLNEATKSLINEEKLSMMKDNVILVNAARGAVTDEKAISEAVKNGRIAGFGSDVYNEEPFSENHPFYEIMNLPNVLLTPHMAWGSFEARIRCINEIYENILSFNEGKIRNRVDL